MKKKWKWIILLVVIFGFFLLNDYVGSKPMYRCNVLVDFDISDVNLLKSYVNNYVWVRTDSRSKYIKEKRIRCKMTENLLFWNWVTIYDDEDKTNRLGNLGTSGGYWKVGTGNDILYHDVGKRYPYYDSGKWGNNFVEIAENYYILEFCNVSGECNQTKYEKDQIEKVNFDGTYEYKGKTFVIENEDLVHLESQKHYDFFQTDDDRISISGQIISEIPSYRFWIDEEGNIILFSDGSDVWGLENDEIIAEYPFYVLERQK